MIENLNKANFWNELHELCPEAVEFFMQWFEEYKKEVNWEGLFGNNVSHLHAPLVKFDNVPFEFQNGIMARFELQFYNNRNGNGKEQYYEIANQYKGQVRNLFVDLQKQLLKVREQLKYTANGDTLKKL